MIVSFFNENIYKFASLSIVRYPPFFLPGIFLAVKMFHSRLGLLLSLVSFHYSELHTHVLIIY